MGRGFEFLKARHLFIKGFKGLESFEAFLLGSENGVKRFKDTHFLQPKCNQFFWVGDAIEVIPVCLLLVSSGNPNYTILFPKFPWTSS